MQNSILNPAIFQISQRLLQATSFGCVVPRWRVTRQTSDACTPMVSATMLSACSAPSRPSPRLGAACTSVGSRPMWKQGGPGYGQLRPASRLGHANRPPRPCLCGNEVARLANWRQKLAEAWGSRRIDLALGGASGAPTGRSLYLRGCSSLCGKQGGLSQRQIMPSAAPSFGQLLPVSHMGQ